MTDFTITPSVMQSRIEPHDSLDDFPTPPWATRALIEKVLAPVIEDEWGMGNPYAFMREFWTAREPCANRGYMVRPLAEYFGKVIASDIFDYGEGYQRVDYLFPGPMALRPAQITAMNPPFELALEFIKQSFETPHWLGTAAFVRSSFTESEVRYKGLYRDNPPSIVAQFVERVVLTKGIVRDPNKKYWNPNAKNKKTGERTGAWVKPSTATSYCWLVWLADVPPLPTIWIPPCRRSLERPGDYPITTEAANETPVMDVREERDREEGDVSGADQADPGLHPDGA